jgi:DNA processing protein
MVEVKDERRYWLAFSVCNGIGPVRFEKLLRHFGSAQRAWSASLGELKDSGIGEMVAREVLDFRKKFDLEEYETKMQRLQVTYLTLHDEDYPMLLKKIKKPPVVLYKKGTYRFNRNDTLVSVVGTRKITEYGKEITGLLVADLVRSGCVVVSGLAMGVDATAHQATISAGGTTVAVLGSGVDVCTPEENTHLYDEILECDGAIVSEYPLGMMPNKGSFPARNRIIAGLSRGVLVTEGAEDSGSLITARDAFENNRNVFAVPGPITSSVSKGPIALIAQGAKMVTRAADIVNELGIKNRASRKFDNKKITGLTREEKRIVELLQDQKLHFDEIVKRTGFDSSKLGTLVSLMEMKGLIKSWDAGFFGLTGEN